MVCVIGAGASSAASIALRRKFSERLGTCSWHGMQHACVRACMILRYDVVLYHMLKLYTSYILHTLPAQCSAALCRSRVGRPAITYT